MRRKRLIRPTKITLIRLLLSQASTHCRVDIPPATSITDLLFYQICPTFHARRPRFFTVKFVFPLGNHQHRQRIPTTFSAVRAISRIRSTPAITPDLPAEYLRYPALPAAPQTHARHASNPFRGHHQRQHQNDSCQMDRSMPYS